MAILEKAPDAFRTISEVAEDLDVPQHVLRFWESRFAQIKPMKRGGGRRYYRPEDVDLLRGIRFLLYGEGYTIRGVQRILREQGIRFVQSVWQEGAPGVPPSAGNGEPADGDRAADDRALRLVNDLNESDAAEDGGDAMMMRIEPSLHPAPLRLASDPVPQSPHPPITRPTPRAPALSREQITQLRDALKDLCECRALLDRSLDDEEE